MNSDFSRHEGYISIGSDQIYYEIQGSGQPLLLMPGGTGDSWWLHKIANFLAQDFKVISYDLRGAARSISNGPINVDIGRHSSDAVAVLTALGEQSAYIVGVSSGAIIGLDLASKYPDYVKGLIAFEPPLIQIHPRSKQLQKLIAKVYNTALKWGGNWAGLRFALGVGLPIKPVIKGAAEYKDHIAKTTHRRTETPTAYEYLELLIMTNYKPQIKVLKNSSIRIYTGAAKESLRKKRFYAETAKILASQLDCEMVVFPGHHFSFFHDAEACAGVITKTLTPCN